MKLREKALALGACFCLAQFFAASGALADESPFSAIYTTETLPAGAKEMEQWLTWEHRRPYESWNRLAGRTEFEYGVTNRFQVALYANYDWIRVRPHSPLAGDEATNRTKFTSVSAEAIYRFTDSYTHPVGFAVYVEPGYGANTREVEVKVMLDSHFLDNRLTLAINPVIEWEWEREHSGAPFERATELTLLAGLSYNFSPGLYGGVEFEAKREGDGALLGESVHPAADSFRVGPTLHYGHGRWWMTVGALAQLPWAGTLNNEPGEVVNGFAHEVPRFSLRLRFGLAL